MVHYLSKCSHQSVKVEALEAYDVFLVPLCLCQQTSICTCCQLVWIVNIRDTHQHTMEGLKSFFFAFAAYFAM